MPEETPTEAATEAAINPLCIADHPVDVIRNVQKALIVLRAADQGAGEAIVSDHEKREYSDGRWLLWRMTEDALDYARRLIEDNDKAVRS